MTAKYQPQRTGIKRLGLQQLIDDLPYGLVMAEIGSYAGESAEMFVTSGKVTQLYCIDPWAHDSNYMRGAKAHFDSLSLRYDEIIGLQGKINDFIEELPLLDFVYIDGNHSYKAVKNDIIQVLTKLKKGALIGGHDYSGKYEDRVMKAVNETLGVPDKVYLDSSWIKHLN